MLSRSGGRRLGESARKSRAATSAAIGLSGTWGRVIAAGGHGGSVVLGSLVARGCIASGRVEVAWLAVSLHLPLPYSGEGERLGAREQQPQLGGSLEHLLEERIQFLRVEWRGGRVGGGG